MISAAIGNGELTISGDGMVELTGASDYAGGTTVTDGTLLANNLTGSATGSGTVTLEDGATLGGTGKIGGSVVLQSGSTLTGGTDGTPGALTIGGSLTAASGSTWLMDLADGSVDQILIAMNLDLSGSPELLLRDSGSWTLGDTWTIAQFTSYTPGGQFFGLANQAIFYGQNGGQFRIDYLAGSVIVTAVPEPSAVTALVVLLAGGLWAGRRLRGQSEVLGARRS